jgi:hypothetical protein
VSDRKIMSAPFVVIAAIFRSRFDESPVRLKELQFCMSKLTGIVGGALAAPFVTVPDALGGRTPVTTHALGGVSARVPPQAQQAQLRSIYETDKAIIITA